MKAVSRFALVVAILITPLAGARAQQPPPARETLYLASALADANTLLRSLEYLEQDLIEELSGRKERTLYRQAEAALGAAEAFRRALKPEVSREKRFEAFDEMDRKVHGLLKGVRALGAKERALQRAADRVQAADEQLHYTLFGSDLARARPGQVLHRQGEALVLATRDLERVARYALGATPGRGVLEAELSKLHKAALAFTERAERAAERKDLRRDFAEVDRLWERVSQQMRQLPPREHYYLLRSAGRVDQLHERLHRLLGIEGKRSGLVVPT
jgi:hypothetical protein